MDKLNGQLLSYYGFVLVGYSGIMDMAQRLGETFYDWGDYQQPLVEEEDIFWKSRDFNMNVLFDERKTSKTLNYIVNEIANLPECLLESEYGNFTVKVKEIQKVNTYGVITKLTLVLNERIPNFNAVLNNPIGGNSVLIDGYDFKKDFGIIISKVKPLECIPSSKLPNITVFNTSQKLSEHRNFKKLEFDCVKHYQNKSELTETTEKFKKLLSMSGHRIITLNNQNYNCFLTDGFKVVFAGSGLIKFKLKLNITANFVEKDFVLSGFVN